MMRAIFIIAVLLVAAPAFAKHSAHSCKASIYAVTAQGHVAKQPLISSQQVASLAYRGVDQFTGMGIWRIVLTPKGATVNARYTKSHLGGKLAVLCGNVSVGEFAIQAPSAGSFIISSNELGP